MKQLNNFQISSPLELFPKGELILIKSPKFIRCSLYKKKGKTDKLSMYLFACVGFAFRTWWVGWAGESNGGVRGATVIEQQQNFLKENSKSV